MRAFTVHAPQKEGSPLERAERMAFVKDGFSWPALFVPLLWLPWHRMWTVLLGWLAIIAAIVLAGRFVPAGDSYAGLAAIVFAVLFALEANALRRWSLGRKGWRFIGVAVGRDRDEAEYRFFTRWAADADHASSGPVPSRFAATPRPARGDEPVIGLFPKPE